MQIDLESTDALMEFSQAGITAKIGEFSSLNLQGVRAVWAATFRRDAPNGLSRDLLVRTLAWRLQEKAFGGHDKAITKLLNQYARGSGGDPIYRRLKAGTVLVREYQNVRHMVTLTEKGYLWEEKVYPNLTVIARTITGTNWNGPRFFGLRESTQRPAEVAPIAP
jgi:hypothetical protein